MHAREGVYCPACPDPEKAFRLKDVGMRVESENLDPTVGGLQIRVTRPAWEPVILAHLEAENDEAHRRLYEQCMSALTASGTTAEQSARQQVQATAEMLRRSMEPAEGSWSRE